ncbi:surfeit locus protein 2 isoform X1 [Sinocyclocheilus anshuiensis]|uniref:Surfeit 2 n=1 Tax=Sinocyclocheilus anshuiensis TaxID=1608454 RepID=A0A671M031_9TELE|nr:PREDICTED: surfeit locus protein 2 isoform X1 [Sinocyclocheilus anshuiensis]
MEDFPEDLRSFLQTHPCFQLTDSKKIRCSLNAHEFPRSLAELQRFTAGNKYKKLRAQAEFDYTQYEPHIVRSTKQPDHLFCKLTLRHINRVPQHVLCHVSGRRYRRALEQYEECVRQGVEFVPVQLKKKKRPKEAAGSEGRAAGSERRASRKQDSGVWTPNSSDGEDSDSSDSMSDLYPPSVFTVKKTDDEQNVSDAEEDDFQTDDDDDEDVSEMEVENQMQKRKKVQSAGFTKKIKKNKKKKGFKHVGKVNGK